MSGQSQHGAVLPAPRRRPHALQPPSLLTTTLGNAHASSHGVGASHTPISTTSLSSPFSLHQASSYPGSPGGAMRGTSPMAVSATTSYNAAYNPQQWGPVSSNGSPSSRNTIASTRQASHGSTLAPRLVGPDGMSDNTSQWEAPKLKVKTEPVASPPPPYSPRRDETQQTSPRPTAAVNSPADTVSPDTDTSLYGTPVSAATTISPDFAPKHQNGRSPMPRSQPFFTESPISSGTTYPPPPPVGMGTTSRVRSASKNHTDRLISSLTLRGKSTTSSPPDIAINTLQLNTAQAIANAPAVLQEDPTLRPPASRRAASTGAIGISAGSSRAASRSPSQSRWEPGMPLPPPPPGPPPPSYRSQSLNRPSAAGLSAAGSTCSVGPRQRLVPGSGTSLGPVPPTPADWMEEDQSTQQATWPNRSNGHIPLHIDTTSILRRGHLAAQQDSLSVTNTPVDMHSSQNGHERRDSSSGALFRSPAVRNRSAKGIRERRSESRNGKDRAIEPSSAVNTRDSGLWADAIDSVRPTDLNLSQTGAIATRRTSAKSTPRSGKSIRSLDEALSNTESRLESGSALPFRSNGTTPREDSVRSKHLAEVIISAPRLSSNFDGSSYAMPSTPRTPSRFGPVSSAEKGIGSRGLPPKQRTASEERPVSHLLHIPISDDSIQAPLVPLSPQPRASQIDLLGPEAPTAFAQRANDRHRRFAKREAAAACDSERLDLFLEFIIAESRIRRDQYATALQQQDIDFEDLVYRLFPQRSRIEEQAKTQDMAPATANSSMHASSASESSAQGSLWYGDSGAPSKKHESPLTVSTDASPQTRPESSWWNDYVPSLSPIASMSIVTGQDEMDSRGRAPSRWFEGGSVDSSYGDAFRVLERSKRESKYMGVPREARQAPAIAESNAFLSSERAPAYAGTHGQQRAYDADEYPPEKSGWHEEPAGPAHQAYQPSTPKSAPLLSDRRQLDISRLVTLPPPYPRHYPAVNNNHPDLAVERGVVRALNDAVEPTSIRDSFKSKMAEKRQRADSWSKHQRSLHEQDVQFKMEHGEMSQEEFDQAEADIESKILGSEKEMVQADFDLFQEMVVSPLHALFAERITKATSSLDVLSSRLFSDAQSHSPNLPQEEGDEQAELLEKLTQLKWLFEARENLHSETYKLLTERNDKYKAVILLPYQQSKNHDKLAEAESFFARDARDRQLAFEQAVASRCEAFLAVVENNVVRGVEVQLSAFWDIAPSLVQILQKIPAHLHGFEIQIPAEEFDENPSYHDHPLQYLYSLLSHAEKSTHQFIESQINLLCLLHEIRSLALAARFRVEESTVSESDWTSQMARGKLEEEKALMDDLKEKVGVVEGQWVEGLGSRIRGERERVRDWLVATVGWDEETEWD